MDSSILSHADLLALVESGRQLASDIDLDSLLKEILLKASRLTDSPDGTVYLADPAGNGLFFASAIGEKAPLLLEEWGERSSQRVPLESKAGRVFTSGEPLIEDSLESDAEHFKGVDQQTRTSTRSMVCVPLEVTGNTAGTTERIGAIQILNKRSGNYTGRDCTLLEHYASQAAVAIRNASLFRDLVAHMGLYSSQQSGSLLDQLNAPPRSERLTMLFADMRAFTQLCQVLGSPELVHDVIGKFLTMLSEHVLRHDGVVNKTAGDGLFAFFRGKNAPHRAVKCAFEMVEAFRPLRSRWDQDYNQELDFLDIGIGITTGNVIVGTLGSGRMRDYTAIGVPVNLAAAFEKEARGGKRILADQATWLAVKDIVGEMSGPVSYELRKPDQRIGVPYKQFHLIRLKSESPKPAEGKPAGRSLKAFLCHASGDKAGVRGLYRKLREDGFEPWLDEEDLLPGQDWHREITRAVRAADVVIVCLSKATAGKEGYIQKELRFALDVADEKPEGAIFMIPAKLEECDLPERLSKWQFVNLFEESGYDRLRRTLKARAKLETTV